MQDATEANTLNKVINHIDAFLYKTICETAAKTSVPGSQTVDARQKVIHHIPLDYVC